MKYKISKELFNEVMKNVGDIYNMKVVNDYLFWDNGYSNQINIYELAYKCKEWAYENDYYVYSIFTFAGEGSCYLIHEDNISKRLKTFDANNEPEAIFKACDYILKELSNK